jgi:hypothetical protein
MCLRQSAVVLPKWRDLQISEYRKEIFVKRRFLRVKKQQNGLA